ncbi:MAG: transposase [Candidatus Xenolissoclinum pacificiensis L6]|uniref:Transposase n=1 Tax=Candidatus Xenolissoclinum pacificiensis L6 TaxID=1401685 RepID=W2V0P7_9RICK|nr:MAG: transposase [Candidatus Xenolissoclinum pacificiensis L6]
MEYSGYQGINHYHKNSVYPYKNAKSMKVSSQEKDHNTLLAKTRIKVEHVIRTLKTFSILPHRYHNKRKRYHIKCNIIAGIVNLNHGF